MWLATSSEMFADLPDLECCRCPLCEVMSSIAEDCSIDITGVRSAGKEHRKYDGESELVAGLLCFLCQRSIE